MLEPSLLREVDEAFNSDMSLEAVRLRLLTLASDPITLRMLVEALVLKAYVQAKLLKQARQGER